MSNRETDRNPLRDAEIEALLALAASRPPDPLPERVHARLLADALARLPAAAPAAHRRRPTWLVRLGWLWQPLGGAPGLAGMTAAGLAGLWIGAAAPEPVAGVSTAFWQGAALISPDLAELADDAGLDFGDDPLLALLTDE